MDELCPERVNMLNEWHLRAVVVHLFCYLQHVVHGHDAGCALQINALPVCSFCLSFYLFKIYVGYNMNICHLKVCQYRKTCSGASFFQMWNKFPFWYKSLCRRNCLKKYITHASNLINFRANKKKRKLTKTRKNACSVLDNVLKIGVERYS